MKYLFMKVADLQSEPRKTEQYNKVADRRMAKIEFNLQKYKTHSTFIIRW